MAKPTQCVLRDPNPCPTTVTMHQKNKWHTVLKQLRCNKLQERKETADTLGDNASAMQNYAFASCWVQLPLTIVSACILIFAVLYSKGVSGFMNS